jgi:hypothetical protein
MAASETRTVQSEATSFTFAAVAASSVPWSTRQASQ